MKKVKREPLTIPQQNFKILQRYHTFRYLKKGRWIGTLCPSPSSPVYTVKIIYDRYRPRVFILNPKIDDYAPHRYPDGSLCLYYPTDKSHHDGLFIADTMIPWTAEWLYFYEKWLEDEVWWGPEAPHSPKKDRL
ncbi:hypothetical protein [Metabacillus idriensis]|uniref:hypothetical protein n=1 Tax=Metabacillus idriensis TaxID=324768 RepID=UPI00174D5882|nr:hypothetical protein [Metabacillus idriensis]